MINNLQSYAQTLGSKEDVFVWLKTTGAKNLKLKKTNESELEHIIDFFNSSAAPKRLLKMSLKDAKRKAKEWSDTSKKKGRHLEDSSEDIEMYHSFPDGSFIVKLKTKAALQREGFLMAHCLGGYKLSEDMTIYSYRDSKNMPHATFEIRKNANEIVQIKGKGNGDIHPKYIEPVLQFLEMLDMKIRPNDMKNLGYYHIEKEQMKFLENYPDAKKQVVKVRGEYYAI